MLLSDRDIVEAIKKKRVIISPKPDFSVALGSVSVDLRLGNTFRVFNHSHHAYIDPRQKANSDMMSEVVVKKGQPFILHPQDFVLATTMESLTLPDDMIARLEGRSSLGRLGIVVHSTASVIDAGWEGLVVMELGNLGRMPVALYPGMRVCAVTFEQLSSPALVPYHKKRTAKYVRQSAPLPSRIMEER